MLANAWLRAALPTAFALLPLFRPLPLKAAAAPRPDNDARVKLLLDDSVVEMLKGNYAEAVDTLELLDGFSDDALVNARAGRMLDRARRCLALADQLPSLLTKLSEKSHPTIRLRDGTSAPLSYTDDEALYLDVDGVETPCSPRELHPASLLDLSGRVPLTADLALARAFVALGEKDERTFWTGVNRASSNPALKGSIDSAITYLRELDFIPPGGFVKSGDKWKTGAELKLRSDLGDPKALLTKLRSAKPAEADLARGKLDELLRGNPDGLRAWCLQRRGDLRVAFEKSAEQKTLAKLQEKIVALKGARKHACALIFDEKQYFYPYLPPDCDPTKASLYPGVEQEVERRVDAVRVIWGDEFGEAPAPKVKDAEFLAVVAELHAIRQLLVDLSVRSDDVDKALEPCWRLPADARELSVRNVAGDLYDVNRARLDAPIVATNALCKPSKDGPGEDELRELAFTNAYRAMMGRRQLLWNGKLYVAARNHSAWMGTTGEFSHFEGAEGSTSFDPTARVKLAGYPASAGENIYKGVDDPRAAHDGWVHSSGHHRNLLYDTYTEFGVARVGSYWTQDFGGSTEYKGNLVKAGKSAALR
jgi:hypothetical protein